MTKAARFSALISRPVTSADTSVDDHSADIFMTIIIFSLSGLLLSLVALMLGLPQVWD